MDKVLTTLQVLRSKLLYHQKILSQHPDHPIMKRKIQQDKKDILDYILDPSFAEKLNICEQSNILL